MKPDLLRVLVRCVVACLLTELVIGLGLTAARWELSPTAWAGLVGWGLGAGAALAVTEATLLRFGVVPALAIGAALSPLALLGATFEIHLVATGSSEVAATMAFAWLDVNGPREWAGLALAALFVHGAFVLALHRRATPAGQALAMVVGALLWTAVVAVAGAWRVPEALSEQVLALVLFAPALTVPPGRRLGDRLVRLVRRRAAAPRSRSTATRSQRLVLGTLTVLAIASVRHGSTRPLLREQNGWRVGLGGDAAAMYEFGAGAVRPWSPLPCVVDLVDAESQRPEPRHDVPFQESREWYRLAACRGDVDAMCSLNELDWLAQAAAAGDDGAGQELVVALWGGVPSEYDAVTHGPQRVQWVNVALDALRREHERGQEWESHRLLAALRREPCADPRQRRARLDEALEVARVLMARSRLTSEELRWFFDRAYR